MIDEFYQYEINQKVWILNTSENNVLSCKVVGIKIEKGFDGTDTSYSVVNECNVYKLKALDIYPTLNDALIALGDEM